MIWSVVYLNSSVDVSAAVIFCKPNVRITGTLARLVCCRHSHVELHLNKFSPLYNIEFAYFTRHFEQ